MTAILISDTHWNDKPVDKYRWELFPWLREQIKKYNVRVLVHCGDLTDAKDKHSARLTNLMVTGFQSLITGVEHTSVVILKANHDYIDPDWPFFGFMKHMDIDYITSNRNLLLPMHGKPATDERQQCLFLPSTKDYRTDWNDLKFDKYDYIFTHQTYKGVKTDTGHELDGVDPKVFGKTKAKIYSGDIHMPIMVGPVEYIGAPYRTNFGDTYEPRVILIDNEGQSHNLHFPCPSKHLIVVRSAADLRKHTKIIKPNDHVKIRVTLTRAEFPEYRDIRREIEMRAKEFKWEVFGIELNDLEPAKKRNLTEAPTTGEYRPARDLVREYATAQKFDEEQTKLGLRFIS